MKRIVILCGFLGLVVASSEDLKSSTLEMKKNVKSFLSSESNSFFDYDNATALVDGICSGFTNNIEAEFDKSIDCVANITLEGKTMCRALQTDVADCFENVVIFLEECLEAPGKELPRLFLLIAKSATRYLCESTGEQQLELLNPCLYGDTEFSKRFDEDLSEEKEKFDVETFKLPSRTEICKEFLEDKDLLTSHITAACSAKITQDAAIGFINALVVPCQASADGANTV